MTWETKFSRVKAREREREQAKKNSLFSGSILYFTKHLTSIYIGKNIAFNRTSFYSVFGIPLSCNHSSPTPVLLFVCFVVVVVVVVVVV